MKLSVIIPVFNEEKTIEETIRRVIDVSIPGWEKEIIIVDDGSTDNSKNKIFFLSQIFKNNQTIKILTHEKNLGKGAAIITALQKATGDYAIIQDADLEYNPQDYQNLISVLSDKTPVVYGTRFLLAAQKKFSTHYLANKFLTFLTNLLFGLHLTDMETCFKLCPIKVLKELNLKSQTFEIEPEITAKLSKKGIKIVEVPISYLKRNYNQGKKIKFKDGILAMKILFQEWIKI